MALRRLFANPCRAFALPSATIKLDDHPFGELFHFIFRPRSRR